MDEPDEILKTSLMRKKSFQTNWFVSDLSIRWFMLTKHYLKYYYGSHEKGFQSLAGAIALRNIKYIEKVDYDAFLMKYVFQIFHENGNKDCYFYIVADNGAERHSWIQTIKRACLDEGAQFSKKYHSGAWLTKYCKFSCCDNMNKNSSGCVFLDSKCYSLFDMYYDMCVAIEGYLEQSDDELSIVEGEILKIITKPDGPWLKVVKNNGLTGFVPSHLVKELPFWSRDVINHHHFYLMAYMTKRSQLKKQYCLSNQISNNMNEFLVEKVDNYKKRWFLLNEKYLNYYDGTLEAGITSERNSINLKDVNVIEKMKVDVFLKTNVFQIMYFSRDNFQYLYIITDSEHQRKVWMHTLRNACYNAGAMFLSWYHPGAWFCETGMFSCCNQRFKNCIGCKRTRSNSFKNISKFTLKRNPDIKHSSVTMEIYTRKGVSDPDVYCEQSLLALKDFDHSLDPNEISIYEGEKLKLIEKSTDSRWKVENTHGFIGYVPADYVRCMSIDEWNSFGS